VLRLRTRLLRALAAVVVLGALATPAWAAPLHLSAHARRRPPQPGASQTMRLCVLSTTIADILLERPPPVRNAVEAEQSIFAG
jgi:hypothetical protein